MLRTGTMEASTYAWRLFTAACSSRTCRSRIQRWCDGCWLSVDRVYWGKIEKNALECLAWEAGCAWASRGFPYWKLVCLVLAIVDSYISWIAHFHLKFRICKMRKSLSIPRLQHLLGLATLKVNRLTLWTSTPCMCRQHIDQISNLCLFIMRAIRERRPCRKSCG